MPRRRSRADDSLVRLTDDITTCRACPRLVQWREQVAVEKRAAYAEWNYWGRPVPGFGDHHARVLVLGLAPAAHGANRTGRVFTGDRSGDWLFAALHRGGFANQPDSTHRDDGLVLHRCFVSAAVRCAPPANKPTPAEREQCLPFLRRELALLAEVDVVLVLGQFAFEVARRELAISPAPRFGHGVECTGHHPNGHTVTVLCSYHPSQQNTFTGRLTEPMLDAVIRRAHELTASETGFSLRSHESAARVET